MKPEQANQLKTLPPIISVKNLEKVFEDGETKTAALCDITFDIPRGQFVAVMGPSGSGKSTILHIIGLLDKQTGGSYLFDGKKVSDYSDEEIAHIRNEKLGFIFQSFNLLSRTTVLENVKLPLLYSGIKESLWDQMALKAIEQVGLSQRINYMTSKLSGGERQRVAIARALINNPQVIFADEPTGNLDSKSGQVIMEILQKLNAEKKHTIILITHETYTSELAERIIYIRDGKIESDKLIRARREANNFVK
ncbi:ABC transporter ATP-binding protein [Patescibacteria group bacterium]|nr:ABC transporter ATP-binding protein [Patescibacteria group bacterium]MBU4000042.1 ABC transporter ATP-binding protein [Patescibacteria group bacterium]MBU4056747.1 ABC transporter ATP-binding protein [Patescibacteria group bacterium]MBU4368488.1 ABC transporter ATP-binding protein [Patescibacteria group bacterium]